MPEKNVVAGATELERFKNESRKCVRCMEYYLEDYAEEDGKIPESLFERALVSLNRDLRIAYGLSKMLDNTEIEVEE